MAVTLAASTLATSNAAGVTLTSSSFTPATGDIIVVKAGTTAQATTYSTPTATANTITWTKRVEQLGATWGYVVLYTGTVTAGGSACTASIAIAAGSNFSHAAMFENWTGAQLAVTPATCNGTGTTSAPSTTLTTVAANSVVSWFNADKLGTSPTGFTFNTTSATPTSEGTYNPSTASTFYAAYQTATAAGSQTLGITSPSSQTWCLQGIEIQSSGTNRTSSPADPEGITDTATAVADVVRSQPDPEGITDAAAGAFDFVRSQGDPAGITDAAAGAFGFNRSQGDPAGITDTAGTQQDTVRSQGDQAGITDSLAPVQATVRASGDNQGITDAMTAAADVVRSQADPQGLTDVVSTQQDTVRSQADPEGISDSMSAVFQVGGTGQTFSTNDPEGISDLLTVQQDSQRAETDAVGLTDTAAATAAVVRTQADSAGIADTLLSNADVVRSQGDPLGATDTVTTAQDAPRAEGDATGLSDALTISQGTVRAASDPEGLTDQVAANADRLRAQGDAAGITDSIGVVWTFGLRDLAISAVRVLDRFSSKVLWPRFAVAYINRFTSYPTGARFTQSAAGQRFTAALTAGDTMEADIIVSKGEKRYQGAIITETTGKDISAATFQISLGTATVPGTAGTPDVNTVGTSNNIRTVKKLVDNTVQPGTYYTWIHIGDAPENVILRVQGPTVVR